jgi:hypothetical protein
MTTKSNTQDSVDDVALPIYEFPPGVRRQVSAALANYLGLDLPILSGSRKVFALELRLLDGRNKESLVSEWVGDEIIYQHPDNMIRAIESAACRDAAHQPERDARYLLHFRYCDAPTKIQRFYFTLPGGSALRGKKSERRGSWWKKLSTEERKAVGARAAASRKRNARKAKK